MRDRLIYMTKYMPNKHTETLEASEEVGDDCKWCIHDDTQEFENGMGARGCYTTDKQILEHTNKSRIAQEAGKITERDG